MADKGLYSSKLVTATVLMGAVVFAVIATQMGGTVGDGTGPLAVTGETSTVVTLADESTATVVESEDQDSQSAIDERSSSRYVSDSGASSSPQPQEEEKDPTPFEHKVASVSDWNSAVAAAKPGDVIRLTANISSRLVYRGDKDGRQGQGVSGTAGKPIVITADPGVWIDGGGISSNFGGLDIFYVDHVHAVGLNVKNAQFGIRCLQCDGTAEHPVKIANNHTTDIGYVGIHVGGHLQSHAPSRHVVISGNTVTNTGKLTARYGEGIYLGHGSDEWVDKTSHIVVRSNEISHTTAEAIDIKPGTSDVLVENNRIHDVAPIDGGAISAHYVNNKANPDPDTLAKVTVKGNWIWNHNRNGAPGASDAGIWVGHGGVDIIGNYLWGFRNHGNTRGVRVRSPKAFGPHKVTIKDNVFWLQRGWVADGSPSPYDSVVSENNKGPQGQGIEVVLGADKWWGNVPPIGEAGDADRGEGPGSSFVEPPPEVEPETLAPAVMPYSDDAGVADETKQLKTVSTTEPAYVDDYKAGEHDELAVPSITVGEVGQAGGGGESSGAATTSTANVGAVASQGETLVPLSAEVGMIGKAIPLMETAPAVQMPNQYGDDSDPSAKGSEDLVALSRSDSVSEVGAISNPTPSLGLAAGHSLLIPVGSFVASLAICALLYARPRV